MPASPDLLTLALLVLVAASALGLALSGLTLLWRGRPRERRARARTARHWSRDDHADRLHSAYFSKEQRARAIRERERRERARLAQERAEPAPEEPTAESPAEAPHRLEVHYRAVLELEGEVTEAGVRRAYKRLIAAYHPDKVAGLGVKLREVAEEETKRINEAYAFFCRRHGL